MTIPDTQQPRRRRFSLFVVLVSAIAMVSALVTLLGLAPLPGIPDRLNTIFAQLSTLLIQLVTVIGALAVILGVFNLLAVHWHKLTGKMPSGLYSLVTLFAAIAVVALHLADRAGLLKTLEPGYAPGESPVISLTVMDAVQVAMESALAGLLTFFLVYAAYRLLRRRLNGWNVLFLAALVLVLIGYIPVVNLGVLNSVREWVLNVPVSAGTRGILIGVALGTVVTGVRLLLGQDRSFRE
ncbi:MAG: hypothetical protein ACYDBJ_01800 [Aggregatilineales bacterium]